MYLQNSLPPSAWGLPHEYYENSYFSSYGPNRGAGLSNLHQPTSTDSAAESHNQNESVSTSNEQENSDQELLVVDEESTNELFNNDTAWKGKHHVGIVVYPPGQYISSRCVTTITIFLIIFPSTVFKRILTLI